MREMAQGGEEVQRLHETARERLAETESGVDQGTSTRTARG